MPIFTAILHPMKPPVSKENLTSRQRTNQRGTAWFVEHYFSLFSKITKDNLYVEIFRLIAFLAEIALSRTSDELTSQNYFGKALTPHLEGIMKVAEIVEDVFAMKIRKPHFRS